MTKNTSESFPQYINWESPCKVENHMVHMANIYDNFSEKIRELRKEREAKRKAVLKKRKEPVNRLQNFWAEALINHMIVGELISDEDMEILEFMSSMNVG